MGRFISLVVLKAKDLVSISLHVMHLFVHLLIGFLKFWEVLRNKFRG